MIGLMHFFPYFQVYSPNNMMQPGAQMGQMHLGQEPTEAQVKDVMVGHEIWASLTAGTVEHTSGHVWELGEDWPGSGKTTAFKAQPLPLWSCSLKPPAEVITQR